MCNIKGFFFCVFITFLPLWISAADYSSWSYSRKYNINTTSSGADVSQTVSKFPVMVSLTSSNFDFSQAGPTGNDIRFTDKDGTTDLSYEIESWDSTSQKAWVWVLVPTILGNSRSQSLVMYWGKAAVEDMSDGAAVFQTGNNFQGVWHLNDNGGTLADGYKDATANADHGQGINLHSDSDQESVIGNGSIFNGTQYIYLGTPPTSLGWQYNITVSVWVWVYQPDDYAAVFSKGTDFNSQVPWLYYYAPGSAIYCDHDSYNVLNTASSNTGSFDSQKWTHVAFTWNGSTMKSYVDGTEVASGGPFHSAEAFVWEAQSYIGYGAGISKFNGWLDEVRLSNTVRSASWIKLCYQNQRAHTLLTVDNTAPANPVSPCIQTQDSTTSNQWQSVVSDPAFTWSGATDAGSGLKGYYYYWGTDAAGIPITWTAQAAFNPEPVSTGTWFLRIKTVDNTENMSEALTMYVFKYDGTSPSVPGTPIDEGESTSKTTITFNWAAAEDTETGISSYWLQVGTSPGDSDTYNEDVGNVLSKEISNGAFNTTYYAKVRAKNGSNLWSGYSENSDGILIGNSLPRLFDSTGQELSLPASQRTDGTDTVDFYYQLIDADNITDTILVFFRNGVSGSWTDLTGVSGDYGVVDANDSSVHRHIRWDVADQLGTSFASDSVQFLLLARDEQGQADSLLSPVTGIRIDTDVPVALGFVPAIGDTGVNLEANISLIFSEQVIKGFGSIVIKSVGAASLLDSLDISSSRISLQGDTVTIDPAGSFNSNTEYSVQVTAGAFKDSVGHIFGGVLESTAWRFTSVRVAGPVVSTLYPGDNSIGAGLGDSLVITFYETVQEASGSITIMDKAGDSIFSQISVPSSQVMGTGSGTITITPGKTFASETDYYVLISSSAFANDSGHPFAGFTDTTDWNFTTVDITPPVAVSFVPASGDTGVDILQKMAIAFNEVVNIDSGSITVINRKDASVFQVIDVVSEYVNGSGSNVITISHEKPFGNMSEYFVQVESSVFTDLSGNYFPGIYNDSAWRFTTGRVSFAKIDSITSGDSGWLAIGDTLDFSIHFSHNLFLTGGHLKVPLLTGAGGRVINVEPFDSVWVLNLQYIVSNGDYSTSFDIADTLMLEEGAALVDKYGTPALLSVNDSAKLSERSLVKLDGAYPVISNFQPTANQAITTPVISYRLAESLLSGIVIWKNGTLNNIPLTGDSAYQQQVLTAEELSSGQHEVTLQSHKLVNGGEYFVELVVTDSAGNTVKANADFIKLVTGINKIRISPADTILVLGDELNFTATGLVTVNSVDRELPVSGINWLVLPGTPLVNGLFSPSGLGRFLVEATLNEQVKDTAEVNVKTGSFNLVEQIDQRIEIGEDVELEIPGLPAMSTLEDTIIQVRYTDSIFIVDDLMLKGPTLVLTNNNGNALNFDDSVIVRIKFDTTVWSGTELDKVQLYLQIPGIGNEWQWLHTSRDGNVLTAKTKVLGIFVPGVDTLRPSIELLSSVDTKSEGEAITLSYSASDNISNPVVYLRTQLGGAAGSIQTRLPYIKGTAQDVVIPLQMVTVRGLWYSVEIRDGAQLVSSDTVNVRVALGDRVAFRDTLDEGTYHFISVPMEVQKNKVYDLFSGAWGSADPERWRLYYYSREFREFNDDNLIQPGRSYFLRTKGFDAILKLHAGSGVSLSVSTSYRIPAVSGWNMISNPFMYNLPLSSVRYPNGVAIQHIYAYLDGQWIHNEHIPYLEPWKGYLVWNSPLVNGDSIWINPILGDSVSALGKRSQSSAMGKTITISIENEKEKDGLLVLGFDFKESRDVQDARDCQKPSFLQKSTGIDMVVDWDRKNSWLSDYRGMLGLGKSWQFKTYNKKGEHYRLHFTGHENLPDSIGVILFDKTRGTYQYLKKSTVTIEESSGKEELFNLMVGTREYLANNINDFISRYSVFELGKIAPNPFTISTTIAYAVPGNDDGKSQIVSLDVFNIKGELVRTLVHGLSYPGRYTTSWDGHNPNGILLPSGAYYCRLRVGDKETGKKIIMLR
ncbi:MAG: DUF2341 domain-containing protein [Fibrobacteria bacterium]|nr:DUF2341 domain-containing protein [Fibrobacteria bacterium]